MASPKMRYASPQFEEEQDAGDEVQKSLDESRRQSSLGRRRSRFGELSEDGISHSGGRRQSRQLDVERSVNPQQEMEFSPVFAEEQEEDEAGGRGIDADLETDGGDGGFGPDAPNTKYFGFTKGGKKHGMGTLTGADFEYEGQFRDGHYHGLGRLRTLDFEYEGAFEMSLPQGAGILIKDTGVYKGRFSGSFDPQGMGEIQIPGGAVYRGMISASRLHGFGTLTDSKGKTYTGQWKDGLKEGAGREVTKAGEYVGSWSKGKRHGAGRYQAADWKYEGEWKMGKREGVGLYKEGTITYLGSFEGDMRNGLGKLVDGRAKTSYYGGFLNDMKQGIGFLQFGDGESYFGEWHEDKRHGAGVLVRGKAETKGIWEDDDLHGYAYTTQPGKPPKIEVYSRGRLVQSPGRKPAPEDIDELLARISETLPPSFFKVVSSRLNALVVKEPVMFRPSLLRETENSLKEVDAAVENSRMAAEKDRKDLRTWMLKRGVNPSLDPPKTWDIEVIQVKRSKREEEAELKSTFESQFEEADEKNQTQTQSRVNQSRVNKRPQKTKTAAIKKIEDDDVADQSDTVIIRTARRNGKQGSEQEEDEMVRRKGRADVNRKQAITKREQEARIAEVEADFQKYLQQKEAGNVPEINSDQEHSEADPELGVEIGKKYKGSSQHIQEPDLDTGDYGAYKGTETPMNNSKSIANLNRSRDNIDDASLIQGSDIRKTSLDVPRTSILPQDVDHIKDDHKVYTDQKPDHERSSGSLDIQNSRNDLSRSGRSQRKAYTVPKADFDIDNNDAEPAKTNPSDEIKIDSGGEPLDAPTQFDARLEEPPIPSIRADSQKIEPTPTGEPEKTDSQVATPATQQPIFEEDEPKLADSAEIVKKTSAEPQNTTTGDSAKQDAKPSEQDLPIAKSTDPAEPDKGFSPVEAEKPLPSEIKKEAQVDESPELPSNPTQEIKPTSEPEAKLSSPEPKIETDPVPDASTQPRAEPAAQETPTAADTVIPAPPVFVSEEPSIPPPPIMPPYAESPPEPMVVPAPPILSETPVEPVHTSPEDTPENTQPSPIPTVQPLDKDFEKIEESTTFTPAPTSKTDQQQEAPPGPKAPAKAEESGEEGDESSPEKKKKKKKGKKNKQQESVPETPPVPEKKEDKDWRSQIPGSMDELKQQGVGGLFDKGKGMLGF